MDLVVKNGRVITATDDYVADIGIQGGKIAAIGKDLSGKNVMDASGMLVFPGGVDVHTHLDMPFMGMVSADDFRTGTIAAASGGTTCLVDFAIQGKGQSLVEALATWKKKAEGKAVIDYGFHIAITDLPDTVLAEIPKVVEEGVTSFKLFMAYKGSLMVDDGTFFKTLVKANECGALVSFHAENGEVLDVLIKKFLAEGKGDPIHHALSRPPKAEGEATGRGFALAEMANAPIYVVHLSCSEALDKVKMFRDRGLPVYAETCPQYLMLDIERYNEPNFGGAKYVMSPPLREKWNQDVLWDGLRNGYLQTVATDHCPFNFKGQKDKGKGDFSKIPNGAPSLETRMSLLFTEGVVKGRISINRFVEVFSTNPAKLFGLFPEKGTIAVGSDADLVIFDPKNEVTITQSLLHQNVDYTAFEGFRVKGYPVKTIVGGQLVIDNGKFVGKEGAGRYIKRKKFVGL